MDQFQQGEECPYFDTCPLSDDALKCFRFYVDCPRFIDYVIGEERARTLEKEK